VTDTIQDAEREQGMEELYNFFKQQFEEEYIYNKVFEFYKSNKDLLKDPLLNFKEAKFLLSSNFFTASFLHAYISIETGIKMVILKPILFSLSVDERATELLFKDTFKQKSLKYVSKFYYDVLFELSGINFREIYREGCLKSFWEEILELQELRNKIIHQGLFIENDLCERSISVASYLFDTIIPKIYKKFNLDSLLIKQM